jgi:predicted peptidase
MKFLRIFYFLCVSILVIRCSADDPAPVETRPLTNDSTVEVVSDSAAVVSSDSTAEEGPSIVPAETSFPDSAFYRPMKFGDMPYQIMFPRKYDSTKSYPLVIFLHGIDERGTDNQKQLKWGASLFQSDSISTRYPSFVIFPQCPTSSYWADSNMMTNLKALIDNLVATKSIDRDRIYLEGLSMGAYGTYAMVANYPDLFAAAIAISGDGDKSKVHQMAKIDWKIYGGKKDTIVPGEKSEQMAEALRGSGANVSLKIYPNANHVSTWVNAFAEPDFCSWVFSKKKD